MSQDRFKHTVAVIIAVVTTLAAIIALLQGDAAARDDRANRDSKRYANEALGRQVSGDARVNYDVGAAYQSWSELSLQARAAADQGDEAAAARYEKVRDRLVSLSPLLAAPYFDPTAGTVNLARYEADTYLVEIVSLREKYTAASAVKEAWDYKANTYIIHLTLAAVALFLFGLSITISGPATRWIFAGTGLIVAIVTAGWAAAIWVQPVYDLRAQTGAIDAYAQGVGLAYQGRQEEAIAAFDQALQAAPTYANAYTGRAEAYFALENYQAAAADLEKARAAGDESANVAGELAWAYYLLGRFDEASAMNRIALTQSPDELYIRFDLALSLLTNGQIDAARAEYASGMALAAKQVADARAAGQEPPYSLWWSLDASAAADLNDLLTVLDTGEGLPPRAQIANPDAVRPAAQELMAQLKSLAVALEYTGQPLASTLVAQISPLQFGVPAYDDQGEVEDYAISDTFPASTTEIAVLFDYEGMQDGPEVILKVYIDGEEDPSWRLVGPWELGASGSAVKYLSIAYSDAFTFDPGEYVVEVYVNAHLAQRGGFVVLPDQNTR